MEKRKKYSLFITDFFRNNPEISMVSFCREIKFKHHILRDSFYHGYLLKEDDIYKLIYHLSKYKITDPEGWMLSQDENVKSIFARKIIKSETFMIDELKNGDVITREITEEMAGDWIDPYDGQILSTYFEYKETIIKNIIENYEDLN